MSNTAVSILMGIIFVAICAFDWWLDRDGKKGNTYSERIRALGRMWPPARLLLAVGIGVLLGHFFWTPQDVYDAGGRLCAPVLDAGPN